MTKQEKEELREAKVRFAIITGIWMMAGLVYFIKHKFKPKNIVDYKEPLDDMLSKAIAEERYEDAALIRDAINLKKK